MKQILTITALILLPFYCFSQNDTLNLTKTQIEKSTKVVNCWIEELFKAENIEELMKISDLPFALDRKKVVKNKEELKEIYNKIFENKGKRKIPDYTTEIFEYKDEIIDNCIPISVIKAKVIIKEKNEQEGILVCILFKNDEYKIIGFSD